MTLYDTLNNPSELPYFFQIWPILIIDSIYTEFHKVFSFV